MVQTLIICVGLVAAGLCGARFPAVRVLHGGGGKPQPGSGGADPRPGPRHHHHHHRLKHATAVSTSSLPQVWLSPSPALPCQLLGCTSLHRFYRRRDLPGTAFVLSVACIHQPGFFTSTLMRELSTSTVLLSSDHSLTAQGLLQPISMAVFSSSCGHLLLLVRPY